MTRLVFGLIAILAIITGLLVGTLNADPVSLDLFWATVVWPLGLLVLLFFSGGLLLGLALMFAFRVLPLRMKLRKAGQAKTSQASTEVTVRND